MSPYTHVTITAPCINLDVGSVLQSPGDEFIQDITDTGILINTDTQTDNKVILVESNATVGVIASISGASYSDAVYARLLNDNSKKFIAPNYDNDDTDAD